MATEVDSDVPDWGAAFTFGRCRFADNVAGKFWIKDDPILQVACGDEHTAVLAASGRLFTFGNNEWGQLGHGHTRTVTKPSCVKALKGKRVTIVACGRSHTLVATAEGHVYAFGSNSEGQLGSTDEQPVHSSPVRVQGLEGVTIKMLSGGAEHSMALTDKGVVYVWGNGSEGQIGPETGHLIVPTELNLESNIMFISAGYYHSAFVTVDGKLYMCGESDAGKLGLPESILKKHPLGMHCVPGFGKKVVWVSCGGNHTIALTADGKAFSFGNGSDGQLGLGSRLLAVSSPHQILSLESMKVARTSCGENHSAFLTDKGHLYVCGDGRHGKLGLFDIEDISYQFVPTLVTRFNGFQVQQATCGGCHMLVLAVKQETVYRTDSSQIQSKEIISARDRRRQKITKLPPISNKNEAFSPTLKVEYRPRLPSMTKGTVWYVPLSNSSEAVQDCMEEENEVMIGCRSLLDDVEKDGSIRHADSDVESDESVSEISQLNRTHTLIRVDNTIFARPTISDAAISTHMHPTIESEAHYVSAKDLESKSIVKKSPIEMKSKFYDKDEGQTHSTNSVASKDSKPMWLSRLRHVL